MGSIPSLIQWVKGSSIATTVAQVAAVAWIQSLALEFLYAFSKIKKKKKMSLLQHLVSYVSVLQYDALFERWA